MLYAYANPSKSRDSAGCLATPVQFQLRTWQHLLHMLNMLNLNLWWFTKYKLNQQQLP